MFLKCLEHERMMFEMFLTCFEPQNTYRSHLVAIFVDFQQQYVKIGFFTLKKYFKMHVIRNTPCRFVCVRRTDMRQRAFESPDLGQPFKYLGHHHITHRKFFRATWSWKMPQKLTKTQKFRESQLALKNKIWSFARFLRPSFTSTVRNVTIWCALDSRALCQPFKYL